MHPNILDDTWTPRMEALAQLVGSWSKDPSTKVGAVIVGVDRVVRGHGYNGFPRGVHDRCDRYQDRAVKYKMVVHAEANAILNAAAPVHGCCLVCTHFPCSACAALIIQAGIVEVVAAKLPDPRWVDDSAVAQTMLHEAGVRVRVLRP